MRNIYLISCLLFSNIQLPNNFSLLRMREVDGQAGVVAVVQGLGIEGDEEDGVGEPAEGLPDGVPQQTVDGTCDGDETRITQLPERKGEKHGERKHTIGL